MQRQAMPPTRGVFPPRAVAFCRGVMSAVFAALSLAGLVLLIGGLLVLQSSRPSFGQEPGAVAGVERPAVSRGLDA